MSRNTQAVFNGLGSFGIVGYSQDELETIHLASLDILYNVGVRVDSVEAREDLRRVAASLTRKPILFASLPILWKTR